MYSAHLKIDTSFGVAHDRQLSAKSSGSSRPRALSNASSTSSLDIVSPKSSSTNASTLSLVDTAHASTSSNSQEMRGLFVLAMHDYSPQHQSANCLSFRAGQVIRVLNQDSSGWWDGELEGKRGWFPSNYVSADIGSPDDDDEEITQVPAQRNHVRNIARHKRHASVSESLGSDIDSYCPPIMIPLLHGLSLLQNAVRSNRISHFQPSTACIISCVRSVLAATDTLLREAPILQQFPALAQERRKILSILALLVAQAKKASEDNLDEVTQEMEVDSMLRLGGQVFARVRGFLAVAVQCGIELPERRGTVGSIASSTEDECRPDPSHGYAQGATPVASRLARGIGLRARSMTDLRTRHLEHSDIPVPVLPSRSAGGEASQEQSLRDRVLTRYDKPSSHKSSGSASSFSSLESTGSPTTPPFPRGPCTAAQVLEALRSTHDQYLSTIAAFIGHAHSHSRVSHASSTGHMYDLVREIIEMVCKLLTIVEAVSQHPDIPESRVGNLQAAKDGLYTLTSGLAENVRLLTLPLPPSTTDEEEKQGLLRAATGAVKAGADCVAAVKMCLTRSTLGGTPFVLNVPTLPLEPSPVQHSPSKVMRPALARSISMSAIPPQVAEIDEEQDSTVQLPASVNALGSAYASSESSTKSSQSSDTNLTTPNDSNGLSPLIVTGEVVGEADELVSPTFSRTDEDGTTWEGSVNADPGSKALPSIPPDLESIPEVVDPVGWMLSHDYLLEDVAYNSDGHLVGATLPVLVEKMTPHDSIVDPAFSAVFFLTFRLFSSPIELVDAIIARYNLFPPPGVSGEAHQLWQQRKGIPVRLRVSNFIKIWVETYWRAGVDDVAIPSLVQFTREAIIHFFPGPAQRILEMIEMRRKSNDLMISPRADRARDPGMPINPPNAPLSPSEIPRPTMTKTLLVALRARNFASISITDFDALELARQLTIMECNLYCAIQPEEILENGQDGAKPPLNVRAVSSLSTVITGWVAESILNELDIKKRIALIKFFIKVADRCAILHNYSTSRSMLAALDSSTISRLHQTWMGVPQKHKAQLEALRRLADHSRNYHEYRSKLRNTAPPAVPFLGLYLTDVTFCREGNPSHRASPINASKKLINFNKYHKLARIVQDMQRFQVPYNLKVIPEVQEYLNILFQDSRRHNDLQDLYRRSLLVEPKQPADHPPPAGDMRQLFTWAMRSQPQAQAS